MRAKHSKPNKLALRVLSTAAVMAIVTSIAAPAFADAYGIATYGNFNLKDGDIYVEVREGKHYVKQIETVDRDGNITYAQKDGKDIDGTEAEDDDQVTVLGEGEKTDNIINIRTDDKQTADITLDNVNIDVAGRYFNPKHAYGDQYNQGGIINITPAMRVSGAGDTNLELKGENKLNGGNYTGCLVFNDEEDGVKNGTLTIKDDNNDGSLSAKSWSDAAAIGGEWSSGQIVIKGGTINAESTSFGAAIGGGNGYSGNVGEGNVTIEGGDVTAISRGNAAGIGGGQYGNGNVTIKGGTVSAKGGIGAAGIGGGIGGDSSNVTITGGTIKDATGGSGAAGIGGGDGGSAEINISNATIDNVTGGASGIGGGNTGNAKINIKDSTIGTVSGGDDTYGYGASGIGTGRDATATITITNTTIDNAIGKGGGAGIGSTGSDGTSDVTLDKVTVKNAQGGTMGAGVGGGNAKVTIRNESDVTAVGGNDGWGTSGVGSSNYNSADVTIDNSTVVASGKSTGVGGTSGNSETTKVTIKNGSNVTASGSTGIGVDSGTSAKIDIIDSTVKANGTTGSGIGGNVQSTVDVTIEGSTIKEATGGTDAAGIGNGKGYYDSGVSTITIRNSTVEKAEGGATGIGGRESGANIEITGGELKDVKGGAAGIGGNGGWVTIDDATIGTVTGGTAGIGSSTGNTVGIRIKNGKITTVSGGETGAGIDGGYDSAIEITDKSSIGSVTGGTAGIGTNGGTITIDDATIGTVTGKNGSGIGTTTGNKVGITIKNGKITTITGSGQNCGGIDGGYDSTIEITDKSDIGSVTGEITGIGTNGGIITIDDATLGTVTGKNGSGIGSSTGRRKGKKVDITIKNGKITTVSGGTYGGIDGGYGGNDSSITIEKSDIGTVTGKTVGIGIDAGPQATVTIDNSHLGTVIGSNGTGIGLNNGGGLTISIKNGSTIDKVLGKNGSGIGAGPQFSATTKIDIDKSMIGSAIGENGSGIGVGNRFNPSSTAGITVNGSTIGETVGSNGNAGIGGGFGNLIVKLFNSIIHKAQGGTGGAGIGNSAYSNPSSPLGSTNITISNTNIDEAVGGAGAAGIGGGIYRDASVTISGGKITARAGEESNTASNLKAPFAIGSGALLDNPDFESFSNVTITGDDGDTIVNAVASDKEHAISQLQNITVDSLGELHKVLINMRDAGGKILKAIHNRAYVGYPADAEEAEAHAWDGGVIIREATPTCKGLKLYTCTVDGCGATKIGEYDYEWLNVGVIFWDAANNAAAPEYLQGKTLDVENTAVTVAAEQADSVLADKAHWKMAENADELEIHPAADAVGTIYEQAVKASGCPYYVIANVTAQ